MLVWSFLLRSPNKIGFDYKRSGVRYQFYLYSGVWQHKVLCNSGSMDEPKPEGLENKTFMRQTDGEEIKTLSDAGAAGSWTVRPLWRKTFFLTDYSCFLAFYFIDASSLSLYLSLVNSLFTLYLFLSCYIYSNNKASSSFCLELVHLSLFTFNNIQQLQRTNLGFQTYWPWISISYYSGSI